MRERQVLDGACAPATRSVQAIAESIYDGLAPALMPAAHENVRAHLEKLRGRSGAAIDDCDGRHWQLLSVTALALNGD